MINIGIDSAVRALALNPHLVNERYLGNVAFAVLHEFKRIEIFQLGEKTDIVKFDTATVRENLTAIIFILKDLGVAKLADIDDDRGALELNNFGLLVWNVFPLPRSNGHHRPVEVELAKITGRYEASSGGSVIQFNTVPICQLSETYEIEVPLTASLEHRESHIDNRPCAISLSFGL